MRVLVTGAAGQVGSEVVAEIGRLSGDRPARRPRLELYATDRAMLDVANRDRTMAVISELQPDVVIHTAAWTAVDACEHDPDRAFAVNALGTRNIVEAAALVGAHVCYISSDYVFDGETDRPYTEWDKPNPLSAYGRSKLAGELEMDPSHTVVRTSWVSGRTGSNMAKTVLRLARDGADLSFVDDQKGSPTVAADLARKVVKLALERRRGIFHVTNSGETTWCGFARAVLELAGLDPGCVRAISTAEVDPPRAARRPASSVLENRALRLSGDELLPHWKESLGRLVADLDI